MSSSNNNNNINNINNNNDHRASYEGGETALHLAVQKGDVDEVGRLIAAGADVNARTKFYKTTALHIASQHGFVEIACLLVDYGSEVNAIDKDRFVVRICVVAICGRLRNQI